MAIVIPLKTRLLISRAKIQRERLLRALRKGVSFIALAGVVGCSGVANSAATAERVVIRHKRVMLVTPVIAGEGGWCIVLSKDRCTGAVTHGGPIIGETWSGHGPPATSVGVVITMSDVAYVSVGRVTKRIATETQPGLPYGFRTAAVEIHGGPVRHARGFDVALPAPTRFIPIAADGRRMTEGGSQMPLPSVEPVREWKIPGRAPSGICDIRTKRQPVFSARRGRMVVRATRPPTKIGQTLLSCVSIAYSGQSRPLIASVLVDASLSGSAPKALPGMVALAGEPGIFEARSSIGSMVMKRVKAGWLVVAEGSGLQERLALLRTIGASVHI